MKKIAAAVVLIACLPIVALAGGGGGGHDDSSSSSSSAGSSSSQGDDHGGDSSRVVVRGAIVALSSSSITVGGSSFAITGSTVFQKDDHTLTIADFTVNDIVKVKGTINVDTSISAVEVEKEDADGSSDIGDSSSSHSQQDALKRIRRREKIVAQCNLPSTDSLRDGLERAIRSTYAADSIAAQVRVKVRYVQRDPKQTLSVLAAAQGLSVKTVAGAVTLAGTHESPECEGAVSVKITVTLPGSSTPTNSTARLAVKGRLMAKS